MAAQLRKALQNDLIVSDLASLSKPASLVAKTGTVTPPRITGAASGSTATSALALLQTKMQLGEGGASSAGAWGGAGSTSVSSARARYADQGS